MEFRQDVTDVGVHCAFGDEELLGYVAIGQALGDQLGYFEFSPAQSKEPGRGASIAGIPTVTVGYGMGHSASAMSPPRPAARPVFRPCVNRAVPSSFSQAAATTTAPCCW